MPKQANVQNTFLPPADSGSLIPVAHAAAILGTSAESLLALIRRGDMPGLNLYRLGRRGLRLRYSECINYGRIAAGDMQ